MQTLKIVVVKRLSIFANKNVALSSNFYEDALDYCLINENVCFL